MAYLKLNEVRERLHRAGVHPDVRHILEGIVETQAFQRKQIMTVAENQGVLSNMLEQLLKVSGAFQSELEKLRADTKPVDRFQHAADMVRSIEAQDDNNPSS